MLPSFCCGDFVIIYRRSRSMFKQSDVVVVENTRLGKIIKRIMAVKSEGNLLLAGDNRDASTYTLTLGSIESKQVIGRMIWHASQTARKC